MKNQDRLSGLFWAVAALFICVGSLRLSLGGLHHPGPGFFSFLAGTLLGLLAIILFWQSSKKGPEEKRKALGSTPGTGRMIWMVIALIVYVLGMKYAGFFFSTILFLGFLLRGIGRQKWPATVSVTLLAAILSHIIFQYWLDVQLPRGFLGY
jgi:hypothetical protein